MFQLSFLIKTFSNSYFDKPAKCTIKRTQTLQHFLLVKKLSEQLEWFIPTGNFCAQWNVLESIVETDDELM